LLKSADPNNGNFDKIVIWASKKTLDCIYDKEWILKKTHPVLEKNYILRAWWQWKVLKKLAIDEQCSILFIPGGSFFSRFKPIVNMSQNMLPFDWKELRRYGLSFFTIKLLLLHFVQSRSFKKANGIIFLTEHSRNTILSIIGNENKNNIIISHGIDERFFCKPREQKPISKYSFSNPFRLIYVSTVEPYKHQWNVVKAVCKLRKNNIPVVLDLYGSSVESMHNKLMLTIDSCEYAGEGIKYHGPARHDNIHKLYINSDASIFASSCENLPIILLESMASGLPIACSNIEPMPNILKGAGLYFDPLDVESIYDALSMLIHSSSLREANSKKSHEMAFEYSWDKCSHDTFEYLNKNAVLIDTKC
jgi:glycosyltransferase involved in cell wall biosynthesis